MAHLDPAPGASKAGFGTEIEELLEKVESMYFRLHQKLEGNVNY